jgi:hypothetical protein
MRSLDGGFAAQDDLVVGLIQTWDVPELQPRVTKQSCVMQGSQPAYGLVVHEFIEDIIAIVGSYLYVRWSRRTSCYITFRDIRWSFG